MQATDAAVVIAPSPLAGEGSSIVPQVRMGEGYCRESFLQAPPHPL
jgi:hypothetical protein